MHFCPQTFGSRHFANITRTWSIQRRSSGILAKAKLAYFLVN
jgi:hypothetical protein